MKMSSEAEKVISMSLCKMAESRTIRRGGTSLHKHLLIASVLTKATRARSAFLDTWYMGDDSSEGQVDMNTSYQEADFPTDELDSTVGENSDLEIDPSLVEQVSSSNNNSEIESTNASKSTSTGGHRHEGDIESEIDLPPDILSCVEKLGDLNDRIFSPQKSASSGSSSSSKSSAKSEKRPLFASTSTTVIIPDVITCSPQIVSPITAPEVTHEDSEDSHLSSTLTYLDLDAGSSTVIERGSFTTSTPAKRRREWCFEDDEEDQICGDSGGDHCIETPIKPPANTNLFSNNKNCKRLRFDDDSGISSPEKSLDETGVPSPCAVDENSFKAGSFRLTYEDVNGDDSDDDSFLDDASCHGQQIPSQLQVVKARHRNDRRVPSSSSSGSCSDEDVDGESSMEVDQITNLVQFISFNKQQQQAQGAANLRSISCIN